MGVGVSARKFLVRAACGTCAAVLTLLPGAGDAAAGGIAPPTHTLVARSATGTTNVGHLAWEITETSTGRTLGQGRRDILANEVLVIAGPGIDQEQRVPLSDGFYLKLDSGRAVAPFYGFALSAGRDDRSTFSWEWFTVDSPGHARKLQESGQLESRQEKIGHLWEITHTRFGSDVSMRVSEVSAVSFGTSRRPTWRVRILKGSHLDWPTQAGPHILPPSGAQSWYATHPSAAPTPPATPTPPPPPSPGLWSHLVRAAAETTTGPVGSRQP